MSIVYHGSKIHGLQRIEPRKSTHGSYVYATKDKVLALIFSGRCGDDLTFEIGHFDSDKNGPWELVENVPGAFEKMFSNSSSIYSFSDGTFKNIHTCFEEVVSQIGVDVVSEEIVLSVYDEILKASEGGLIKLYRYPDKPLGMKQDGTNILDMWRFYKNNLNKEFDKYEFDRFIYLHPELLEAINDLALEFGYDYHYEPEDLIELFKFRIQRQLFDLEHEQYIDCAYISICNSYPKLIGSIDTLYQKYKEMLSEKDNKKICR